MNNWQKVKLKDVVSILGDGLHGTPTYDDSGEHSTWSYQSFYAQADAGLVQWAYLYQSHVLPVFAGTGADVHFQ